MAKRNPRQLVIEAKQIARDYGCFVAEVNVRSPEPATDYVVYRRLPDGKAAWLGKRSSPAGLHKLVRDVTGFH